METRANYVLIGAFALAGFFGILTFFLWFAQIEFDRRFAYYDVDFRSVSGLSNASVVRFAGLPVGQVVDVRLAPNGTGRVRARLEVDAETPVRADSVATIEVQGVTGVSFVAISPGTPEVSLLAEVADEAVPRLPAGQSVLQSLTQDAPEILSETLAVVRELRRLLGGENQERIEAILGNVEQSSASFATALEDFSTVSGAIADFGREIGRFNAMADKLSGDVTRVLETTEATLVSIDSAAEEARALVAQGTKALQQAERTVAGAERYITESLRPATERMGQSVGRIDERVTSVGEGAEGLIAVYTETGQAAAERLADARETLAKVDGMLARLEDAVGRVAEQVPAVADELRAASRSAQAALGQIERTVGESSPGVRDFATGALPQYARLAAETRALVKNLDTLIEQIRRDPRRFFLDPRAPEFRR